MVAVAIGAVVVTQTIVHGGLTPLPAVSAIGTLKMLRPRPSPKLGAGPPCTALQRRGQVQPARSG